MDIRSPDFPRALVAGKRLLPLNIDADAEPYLIEIPPGLTLQSHFFAHKGQEFGYLLSGELHLTVNSIDYTLKPGELVYLTSETPGQWINSGKETATCCGSISNKNMECGLYTLLEHCTGHSSEGDFNHTPPPDALVDLQHAHGYWAHSTLICLLF